jgi:hypothetical protein
MTHLIPTYTTVSAQGVAHLFKDNVWKLHGFPRDFVTDQDSKFTSIFWEELQKLRGIKGHKSTAYHPQSDGQTERVNRVLEDMLRHYVSPQQDDWDVHLAFAEYAINNSYQESIRNTPFWLNDGRNPHTPLSWWLNIPSRVPAVEDFVKQLKDNLQSAKEALQAAQQRQKHYADRKRGSVEFSKREAQATRYAQIVT